MATSRHKPGQAAHPAEGWQPVLKPDAWLGDPTLFQEMMQPLVSAPITASGPIMTLDSDTLRCGSSTRMIEGRLG